MAKKKIEIIIHAAKKRKALCKFSSKDPSQWPKGNYWAHPDHSYVKKVNCKDCKRKLK